MKMRMLLLAALFPFLHETSYTAQLVSCRDEVIVLSAQGSEFAVTLFNTKIQQERGWHAACSLLEQAATIRFEIDPAAQVSEPLSVYLFADEVLLQEELMRKGYAYPLIRNPAYMYEERLEEAYGSTQVMAQPVTESENDAAAPPFQGPLYLFLCSLLWMLLLYFLLRRRKRRKGQPYRKKYDTIRSRKEQAVQTAETRAHGQTAGTGSHCLGKGDGTAEAASDTTNRQITD